MYDLNADYEAAATSSCVDWSKIDGKRIVVTGVTGLIGGQIVATLAARNRLTSAGIEIVCPVRDEARGQAALQRLGATTARLVPGFDLTRVDQVRTQDITDLGNVPSVKDSDSSNSKCFSQERLVNKNLSAQLKGELFIHAAAPTTSQDFQTHPVDVARAIVFGTYALLELAIASKAESFCYLSSMEVYGNGRSRRDLEALTESELGSVDLCNPRSCYPEAKRMAECFVTGYSAQHGLNAHTVRLAQTFGPGISPTDNRLFAQVARAALTGDDMILKTSGTSTRMYLYTADAVTAVLAATASGDSGAIYNAANPSTLCSVKEMCEMVSRKCSPTGFKVLVEIDPNAPYPPDHHLPLNVDSLRELGWQPSVELTEMFDRLIAYLR